MVFSDRKCDNLQSEVAFFLVHDKLMIHGTRSTRMIFDDHRETWPPTDPELFLDLDGEVAAGVVLLKPGG